MVLGRCEGYAKRCDVMQVQFDPPERRTPEQKTTPDLSTTMHDEYADYAR